MKKIAALFLLSALPSFMHTMESSLQQSPEVLDYYTLSAAVKRAIAGKEYPSIALQISSRDGKIVVILQGKDTKLPSARGIISLWDGKTGKLIDEEVARAVDVTDMKFNQDGTKVVVYVRELSRQGNYTNTTEYAVTTGLAAIEKALAAKRRSIKLKTLSPDTTKIAVLDTYGDVSLWDEEQERFLIMKSQRSNILYNH